MEGDGGERREEENVNEMYWCIHFLYIFLPVSNMNLKPINNFNNIACMCMLNNYFSYLSKKITILVEYFFSTFFNFPLLVMQVL
jgi:hypothetical protein